MSTGASDALIRFLFVGPLSSVILLTWVVSWWRPRLRPGVVAVVGLVTGVVAVVAAGWWPDEDEGGGLSSVSTASVVLYLNGSLAVWVGAVLLLVTAVVAVVRRARSEGGS